MNGWDTKQFHKKTGKISGDAQEESAFQTLALFLQNLKDSEVLFFFFLYNTSIVVDLTKVKINFWVTPSNLTF